MAFIEHILAEKRDEIREKRRMRPIQDLEKRLHDAPVRDFRRALRGGMRIIAELKARTPTVAAFRQSGALEALAETYAENGAAALSVVTDERNFGTSLQTVQRVRSRIGLPVLVKDFVVDPYQVLEARSYGADAILLIARLLDAEPLARLLDLTHELGMTALVETHDADELQKALRARAAVVGVNNRDLDTMTVSLETTRRLAPLVPPDVTLVAESGIRSRADVVALAACGADAFLIGARLLDAEDPGALLREWVS